MNEPTDQHLLLYPQLLISKGQTAEGRKQALDWLLLIYVEDLDPESIKAKTMIWVNTIFSSCSDWFNGITPCRVQAPSKPCCFAK